MEEPFGAADRYGPVLRFGFFLIGPLEFVEGGSGDAARFEPLVAVCFTAGAVGPSAFLGDVERTRWIDGRGAPMSLADAYELNECAIHGPESASRGKAALTPLVLALLASSARVALAHSVACAKESAPGKSSAALDNSAAGMP